MKILIAGMGNVLRGDDGFGIRVIDELSKTHNLAEGVDLYEAGKGGIAVVHELMRLKFESMSFAVYSPSSLQRSSPPMPCIATNFSWSSIISTNSLGCPLQL